MKLKVKIENKIKLVLKDRHDYWKQTLNPFEGLIHNTNDKLKEIESDMRENGLMDHRLVKDSEVITKKKYLN